MFLVIVAIWPFFKFYLECEKKAKMKKISSDVPLSLSILIYLFDYYLRDFDEKDQDQCRSPS